MCVAIILFFSISRIVSSAPVSNDTRVLLDIQQQAGINFNELIFEQSDIVYHRQTNEQLMKMKQKIEKVFEMKLKRVSSSEDGSNIVRYEGEKLLSTTGYLRVAWIGKEETDPGSENLFHAFFMVQVSSTLLKDWNKDYAYLNLKLKQLNHEPKINVSLNGNIQRMLSSKDLEVFLNDMITSLSGKVIEGLIEDSVVSLSGYSTQLDREVETPKGKISFQVLGYVDEETESTNISIGTPVITLDH